MEPNKSKKIAVGLFIISGFVLLTIAIFVIGSKENFFTQTFQLRSYFETVSGLKSGSSVRLNGISIGKVDAVEIEGTDKVLVTMTLERSVQKFIKKDSKATVSSEGLVGNKVIELTPGGQQAPSVQDNEIIVSVRPVEVQDIIAGLKESSDNAADTTKDLSEITSKVNSGEGTLGQLVNNDHLYRTIDSSMESFVGISGNVNGILYKIAAVVDNMSGDISHLTATIRKITDDISQVTFKMNSSEGIIGTLITDTVFANNLKGLMQNANATTKNLENGSFSFAQNMEALKHNFLFKGYFEDIGYWDKADWEKNMDKKGLELRIKEQELLKKEKELHDLEQKIKNEQKLENDNK
jgi:phospholipid/cholesterol/gamma-HCH transport system substrate-binding protein